MLTIVQISLAVLIIILILLQERSAGMSGLFGGGGDSGFYQARRGMERAIFWTTIVAITAFATLAVLQILW